MTEKTILLEEIDPIDIYGVNNRLINLLKSYFPKMSVVARGSEIILKGSAADVKRFESKIELLTEMRMRKSRLTEDDVNSLFDPLGSGTVETKEDDKDVIVFGNEGKIIRARTKNQRRLVESYYKNDLIFAIGPAGTGKTYTAIALAVRALKNKEVKRLILTRPAVEA